MANDPGHRPSIVAWIALFASVSLILALVVWTFSLQNRNHWREVALARSYLDRGQADLAFQAVSGIRDTGPGAPEGLTIAARALLMRGNVAPARRVLERTLKMKADQSDATKMLAAIYLAAGDGQRAITILKEAARLEPADFRPWYALGKLYHDLGDVEASASAYSEALKRKPPPAETRESRIGRARALLDANHPDGASAELSILCTQSPDDPQVLALAARQARDQGRLDEALKLAGRALAVDSDNFDALLVQSRAHALLHQPELAVEELEKAVQVKPNDRPALQLLSQLQMSLGRTDHARATQERAKRAEARIELMDQLTKVIDQHPEDPEPRWRMGQAAMEGNLNVLAYQCFQAALDLDPNYQPARHALQSLRSRKGIDPAATRAAQFQPFGKPATSGR
jgi:predicted Zn-dependent protease